MHIEERAVVFGIYVYRWVRKSCDSVENNLSDVLDKVLLTHSLMICERDACARIGVFTVKIAVKLVSTISTSYTYSILVNVRASKFKFPAESSQACFPLIYYASRAFLKKTSESLITHIYTTSIYIYTHSTHIVIRYAVCKYTRV